MTAEGLANTIQKIGRYRVTGELGRGGMGVVYQGEDRLIGRHVAIKTLTEVTPELRERFYIEARSGILNHQNIVTVYEVGEHEGIPFIAMEFIDGDSLEKMLRQRKRLPLLEALSIVEQLCAGLGYAHGHGVVHRDVKPANVLVRPDGRVTIVDFGIARLADQTRQLTKTDKLLGTFHYIAPERLKGEASDGRADIWSVGVMLYEMLTGELPFKGGDLSSLYRVIHEPYVPLVEHIDELPDGLSRILDKALAKEVEARYATAEEMAFDVQVLGEGLKHDRVAALLETARRLTEEKQYSSARTVLLQAQRIDSGNIYAKALLGDVQDRLSEVQRGEQLRQIVEQAQAAANSQQWNEAVVLFQRARKLDTDNAFDLDERLQQAQKLKVQHQRVLVLWKQADEARNFGDLTKAQDYLGQALKINDRNTELRNAYSDVRREVKRKQQRLHVEELLGSARRESSRQQYAEAISYLREAAEIDPTHVEVQELLLFLTARQKEERRQQALDQAASDVRESLDRNDFESARDRVTRALEMLPGDGVLLQLKSQIESKGRDLDIERVVRGAVLEAQALFQDHPDRALQVIDQGLKEAPDNETLSQFKTRLLEHLEDFQRRSGLVQTKEEADSTHSGEVQQLLEATKLMQVPNQGPKLPLELTKKEQNVQNGVGEVHELQQTTQFVRVAGQFKSTASVNRIEPTKSSEETWRKEDMLEGQNTQTGQSTSPLAEQPRRDDEIRAAIENAVTACNEAIEAGHLDHCMRPLDDLAKRYGANAALAAAIAECKAKRGYKATRTLHDVTETARRQLKQGSITRAVEALNGIEYALPFADADIRKEWQRAKSDSASASNAKQQPITKTSPGTKHSKWQWYLVGVVGIVIALVFLGLSRRRDEAPGLQHSMAAPEPAPAAPVLIPTDMEINASPWAKVVSVRNINGKSVVLPDGDQTTPLRLDGVGTGTYEVTFAGADGRQQTVECNVSAAQHLCTADMGSPDTRQLLMGERP